MPRVILIKIFFRWAGERVRGFTFLRWPALSSPTQRGVEERDHLLVVREEVITILSGVEVLRGLGPKLSFWNLLLLGIVGETEEVTGLWEEKFLNGEDGGELGEELLSCNGTGESNCLLLGRDLVKGGSNAEAPPSRSDSLSALGLKEEFGLTPKTSP